MRKPVIKVRYELLHEHTGGEIPDYHDWYLPGAVTSENNVRWVTVECDNPQCAGLARISLGDILNMPLGNVLPDPPETLARWHEERGIDTVPPVAPRSLKPVRAHWWWLPR